MCLVFEPDSFNSSTFATTELISDEFDNDGIASCAKRQTNLLCHYLDSKLSIFLDLVLQCEHQSTNKLLSVVKLNEFISLCPRIDRFVKLNKRLSAQIPILKEHESVRAAFIFLQCLRFQRACSSAYYASTRTLDTWGCWQSLLTLP